MDKLLEAGSLGFDLARELNLKLAGTEPLPSIIRWWCAVAVDSGYFDSVTLSQLSDIELAAFELAYIEKQNGIYKSRGIPVDDDDDDSELSPWTELAAARAAMRRQA
jgi:hypothetical protein